MNFNVKTTHNFECEAKPLLKKYTSLKGELENLGENLSKFFFFSIYEKSKKDTITDREIKDILISNVT